MIPSPTLARASIACTLACTLTGAIAPQVLATAMPQDGQAAHQQGHVRHGLATEHAVSAGGARAKPARIIAVRAAYRHAIQEPSPSLYLGATQIYSWNEGSLYRLYAAPEQISDIALQAGETLVSVAAGDTSRWVIGDTSSGSGTGRRTHILVKPTAPGLRTNLVIATDRRIYHVEAVSTAKSAMAAISWTYPQDGLIAIQASAPVADPVVAPAVGVDALNFGYRIEGDNVAWRPILVFDDGHQTFIEFPATLGDGEAPPLFVVGSDGKAELVNYRVKGHYYVVDRLFTAAQLRLGGKHQQVVRITRDNGARRLRRAA